MVLPATISVIIPTYNRAAFINRTITSVLAQTWKKIEVIVVDDGSTDNTRTILAPFLDYPNFHYIYQENKGRSIARNEGFRISSGSWIMYLDSDDWLAENALEVLVELIQESAESQIVYANFNFKDKQRGLYGHRNEFREKKLDQQLLMAVFDCRLWLTSAGTYLIDRKLAEAIGGFNSGFEPSEDLDYSIKIHMNTKASYSSASVLYVERHEGNSDSIEIQKAIVRICKEYEVKKESWSGMFTAAERSRALFTLRYRIANGSYEIGEHGQAFRYYIKILFTKPRVILDKFIFKQFFASLLPPGIKKKWKNKRRNQISSIIK
jgi:glycosyltransferase involved in cell wall biosynthesis